jgi:hypothetical protein
MMMFQATQTQNKRKVSKKKNQCLRLQKLQKEYNNEEKRRFKTKQKQKKTKK